MFRRKRFLALLVLVLMLGTLLSACSDSSTSTSAPAPAASTVAVSSQTTAATTTTVASPATTAAATTAARPATTAAATTTTARPATTAAAVTTVAAPSSSGALTLPGLKELTVPVAFTNSLAEQIGFPSSVKPEVKVYSGLGEPSSIVDGVHDALTKAGYKFSVPGSSETKFSKSGDGYLGIYSKSGAPDLLITIGVYKDEANLSKGVPDVSAADIQKIADQLKGQKTIAVMVSANDLIKILSGGVDTSSSNAPTARTVTTPASASTTAAQTTTGKQGSELVGKTLKQGDFELKVTQVTLEKEIDSFGGAEKSKNGNFLIVQFEVKYGGAGTVGSAGLPTLVLTDSAGKEYDENLPASINAVTNTKYKYSTKFTKGETGYYLLVFDLAPTVTGLKLSVL